MQPLRILRRDHLGSGDFQRESHRCNRAIVLWPQTWFRQDLPEARCDARSEMRALSPHETQAVDRLMEIAIAHEIFHGYGGNSRPQSLTKNLPQEIGRASCRERV